MRQLPCNKPYLYTQTLCRTVERICLETPKGRWCPGSVTSLGPDMVNGLVQDGCSRPTGRGSEAASPVEMTPQPRVSVRRLGLQGPCGRAARRRCSPLDHAFDNRSAADRPATGPPRGTESFDVAVAPRASHGDPARCSQPGRERALLPARHRRCCARRSLH